MKKKFRHDISKYIVDVYHGRTGEFSRDVAEDAIRNALAEVNGGSHKFDFKSIRRNKVAIFEIMEEVLDTLVVEGIEDQFGDLVEYRNWGFGDKEAFMVEDYHLFNVASVSAGNRNMVRQRLDRSAMYIDTDWYGIKVYDEWERFMSGKQDLAKMIAKVQRSFTSDMANRVYNTLTTAYNALTSPYKETGTGDMTVLTGIVEHVRAATGKDVRVWGTLQALRRFNPTYSSFEQNGDRNEIGFWKRIDGIDFARIPQSHTAGTDNFAIANNFVLIIPDGEEKIIKIATEGEAVVSEEGLNPSANGDRSVEYEFQKKYGVGVITTGKYGAYILS